MKVPFVDLARVRGEIEHETTRAITSVIDRSSFIMGPELGGFEREFSAYCGRKHGIGVSSGTDALFLCLKAIGVGDGDEVITAGNTFIATFNAISMCNATVVPVDVEEDLYCIDPRLLPGAISAKTRAIIPVDLYGQPAQLDEVERIARAHGIPVVEDACQAHGATMRSRKCGSFGVASCFSFFPAKNLGCFGDGGMVVTDDDSLAETVSMLRNYGQRQKYVHQVLGYNMRLDTVQAAVLNVKLTALDSSNDLRIKAAGIYKEQLKGLEQVVLPALRTECGHVYHLFVIRCRNRDELREHLAEHGVETGIHYPTPPHLQPAYRGLAAGRALRSCEVLAGEILSLPMFPGITEDEVSYVCELIRSFYLETHSRMSGAEAAGEPGAQA